MKRTSTLAASAVLAIVLAGCGGGSKNHSGDVASCLANALAAQAQGIAAPEECFTGGGSGPLSALCTQQSSNEYVCQVTASSNANGYNFSAESGSYQVAFDGTTITYQAQ